MAIDRTRYRQLEFIGARILQARELNWLQEMGQGVSVNDDETYTSGVLQPMFRQGAMLNVTVTTSHETVTLSPTNPGGKIQIFVRDRWESFPGNNDDCTDSIGTHAGNTPFVLAGTETTIYLNWELRIRTGGLTGDDPSLTDSTTNEATASAGELIIHLSTTDTSGVPLGVNQLATNTGTLPLIHLTQSGGNVTYAPYDNVQTEALATATISGLVRTTTANPVVVSTDDPRLGIAYNGSIDDANVRVPVAAGGTNSNGTNVYKLPVDGGTDPGGISGAKVILISTKQLLEDGWNWLVNSFNSLQAAFTGHYTAALGLANTHPLPTAAQVGAAPISHVGLPLGLTTSHPPIVNINSGGFRVNQTVGGTALDPGYGVFTNGTNIASLNHDGDIYSLPASSYTATPGGTGITVSGSLGLASVIAGVLSQHVNQISHANPHGLSASDIGALTAGSLTSFFGATGYVTVPTAAGTLIIQWITGTPVISNSSSDIQEILTWKIPFPNACFFATVSTSIQEVFQTYDCMWQMVSINTLEVLVYLAQINTHLPSLTTTPIVFGIGH